MTTIRPVRPATSARGASLLSNAVTQVQNLVARLATVDTSDVWQLYRMTRGSDSVRPSVIRKLAASAAH